MNLARFHVNGSGRVQVNPCGRSTGEGGRPYLGLREPPPRHASHAANPTFPSDGGLTTGSPRVLRWPRQRGRTQLYGDLHTGAGPAVVTLASIKSRSYQRR